MVMLLQGQANDIDGFDGLKAKMAVAEIIAQCKDCDCFYPLEGFGQIVINNKITGR